MNKVECFKIQLFAVKNGEPRGILQIKNDKSSFFSEPTIIDADPFLFVRNDTLFLFYEQKKLRCPGSIMMTCTRDLRNWSAPREVLREAFHLSYPWVFERERRVYMIPESCADRSIRLYEAANAELTEFRLIKKLLEGDADSGADVSFSDSSIVERDGAFYLFTTVQKQGVNNLLLFRSDNPFGPYRAHPRSPICVSKRYGRNAGSLIEHDGSLYRLAQDCEMRYGDNVHVLKIKELSTNSYAEEVVRENLFNRSERFYRQGGHQLNVVAFLGKTVVATDAKEYHTFFLNRAMHKLGIQ